MNKDKKLFFHVFQPKNLKRMTHQLADSTKVARSARCAALRDFRDLSCFASLRLRMQRGWLGASGRPWKNIQQAQQVWVLSCETNKKSVFFQIRGFLMDEEKNPSRDHFDWHCRSCHHKALNFQENGRKPSKNQRGKALCLLENSVSCHEECSRFNSGGHSDTPFDSGQPLQHEDDGSYKLIRAGFFPFTNTKYSSDLCQITLLQR